ncbi:hypothetical protein BHM03_00038644 [Ensete ventricosum]|nr:hypothetical protein BHM03_00038644 [Ensete ventricosum]
MPHSLRPPTSLLTPLRCGVEVPGSHSIESSRSRHVTEETLGWQFHLRRSETPTLQSGGVQRNGIKFECGKLSTGGAASDAA